LSHLHHRPRDHADQGTNLPDGSPARLMSTETPEALHLPRSEVVVRGARPGLRGPTAFRRA
jgi:hypothetical protein